MRFSVVASIALAAVAVPVGLAQANCPRPDASLTIPDGAVATEDEMKTATAALLKLDQEVGEYLRCIKGEASQETVGKDEQTRTRILQEYVDSHNSMSNALAGLVACFNANLDTYRTTEGGAGGKTADCSTHMEAAKNRTSEPAPGGTPAPSPIVKEADGHSFELETGAWSYTLIRDETPRSCGATAADKVCVKRTVFVTNGSDQELECKAYIKYEGTDAEGREQTDGQAVVSRKTLRAVTSSLAERGVNASLFEAICKPRPPLPPLHTRDGCKYEVVKPVNISDFYPQESRQKDEQGPVVVEFTVPGKASNPTNVTVIATSLSPQLDQAAVRAVSAMVMSSECRNQRYRLRLNFQLEE